MKRWLVIELNIPSGLSEAVSHYLMEQGATGIEEIAETLNRQRLRSYFPADGKEKRLLQNLQRYLKSLETISSEASETQIQTAFIPEQNWNENWKKYYKPVRATARIVVKPPWINVRLKKGQILVDIIPGMAFGTGTHATTLLCIQALERRLKKKGLACLDVGTGSGILSIVAAKLGAGKVLGTDIDPTALENARENVEKNGVSPVVTLRGGGMRGLPGRYDLVVANIDFKGLKKIRDSLLGRLKRHGFLVLSGILGTEEETIRDDYGRSGLLRWIHTDRREEWICLTFKKMR